MSVRFLHILWWNDIKFYRNLVEMIDCNSEFNANEHLFITPYEKVFKDIEDFPNTKLVKEYGLKLLLKYSKMADWIFCHPLNLPSWQYLLIPNAIAKRIIWRTWGHDVRSFTDRNYKGLKRVIGSFVFKVYVRKVQSFETIGIANSVDKVNVQNVFGNSISTANLYYGAGHLDIINGIKNRKIYHTGDCFAVLIAHNGNKADRHIEILKNLRKFSQENIKILISLFIANDADYVAEVKKYAADNFNEKAFFLTESMEYGKFAELIANVDVCVIDNIYSNGLGTLSLMTELERKLYVNRSGNIAQALEEKGIRPNFTDEIENQTFNEFCKKDEASKLSSIKKCLGMKSKSENIQDWNNLLNELTERTSKQNDKLNSSTNNEKLGGGTEV